MIKILSLVSAFQNSTDKRLKESFIQGNVIQGIEQAQANSEQQNANDEEEVDQTDPNERKRRIELMERVRSALISPGEV